MSERFRRSSTKYGPSVCSGVRTHDTEPEPSLVVLLASVVVLAAPVRLRLHPLSVAAPAAPSSASAWRRVYSALERSWSWVSRDAMALSFLLLGHSAGLKNSRARRSAAVLCHDYYRR